MAEKGDIINKIAQTTIIDEEGGFYEKMVFIEPE